MKLTKKQLFGLLAVIFIFGAIYYIFFYSPSYFSYSSCSNSSLGLPNRIESVEWSGNDLIVHTKANANCAIRKLVGNYSVSGETITLTVESKFWPVFAMCNCAYNSTFVLDSLPKKDYTINLLIEGRQTDTLTYKSNGEVSDYCDSDRSYTCYASYAGDVQRFNLFTKNMETKVTQPMIVYDTEENKRIAESDPNFLRLFKKYDMPYVNNYKVVRFYFDENSQGIRIKSTDSVESESGADSPLSVRDSSARNFTEGVEQYVAAKSFLESQGSLEWNLKKRLNLENLSIHANEAGFDFSINGEPYSYQGPFSGYEQKGSINYGDMRFDFETGFPTVSELERTTLNSFIDVVNRVHTLIINDTNIDAESIIFISIDMQKMTASFNAQTNPEKEGKEEHITVHNYDITKYIPIQKSYNLDISLPE